LFGYQRIQVQAAAPEEYPYPIPDSYQVFFLAHAVQVHGKVPNDETLEAKFWPIPEARGLQWVRETNLYSKKHLLNGRLHNPALQTDEQRVSVAALGGSRAARGSALSRQPALEDSPVINAAREAMRIVRSLEIQFPTGPNKTGSAFLAPANGTLLTCAHVVTNDQGNKANRIVVRRPDIRLMKRRSHQSTRPSTYWASHRLKHAIECPATRQRTGWRWPHRLW
jgi:hypothetical protein